MSRYYSACMRARLHVAYNPAGNLTTGINDTKRTELSPHMKYGGSEREELSSGQHPPPRQLADSSATYSERGLPSCQVNLGYLASKRPVGIETCSAVLRGFYLILIGIKTIFRTFHRNISGHHVQVRQADAQVQGVLEPFTSCPNDTGRHPTMQRQ